VRYCEPPFHKFMIFLRPASQEAIADAFGWSRDAMSKIERGARPLGRYEYLRLMYFYRDLEPEHPAVALATRLLPGVSRLPIKGRPDTLNADNCGEKSYPWSQLHCRGNYTDRPCVTVTMRGIAVILSLLIVGCSKPSAHTEKTTLIGGGSGLAAGALAGSGTGALVGGPIGAIGGAAVGAMTAPHSSRTLQSSGKGASRGP
jgi:hypothetical protein